MPRKKLAGETSQVSLRLPAPLVTQMKRSATGKRITLTHYISKILEAVHANPAILKPAPAPAPAEGKAIELLVYQVEQLAEKVKGLEGAIAASEVRLRAGLADQAAQEAVRHLKPSFEAVGENLAVLTNAVMDASMYAQAAAGHAEDLNLRVQARREAKASADNPAPAPAKNGNPAGRIGLGRKSL